MKKVSLLLAALTFACVSVFGDDSQVLPLNYEDFFRADAIAEDGEHLERGEYIEGAAQGTANPFMGNQWNLSSSSSYRARTNPSVEDNTLSYSTYVDNAKGKAIVLDGTIDNARISIYSLMSNNTYSSADGSKSYYLAALVNFTTVSSSGGADFLSFDGNYTATTARARVAVKKGTSSNQFHIGMEYSATPGASTVWSEELEGGNTHLIVVKITPNTDKSTDNIESAKLWLDPDLTKSEDENFAALIVSVTGKGIGSVRGIDIVQKKNVSGKIAGLRFSDNWADVVKAEAVPTGEEADYIKTNFNDGTWGEIKDSDLKEYSTSSINGFELVNAALWNKSATCAETSESFTNRIAINSLSNGGMVTLPTVKNVKQIIIYASSGNADRYLTLQKFDYSAQKWEDEATYHIEDKGVCHRFVTELNSNELTNLRLANADGSTKYIWKIQTCPYPPTVERASLNFTFGDEVWSGLGTSSTTATVNEVDFTLCSRQTGNYYIPSDEKLTGRITLTGKSGNDMGIMELPAVASAARVDIYASAGSADKDLKVQQYNYGLLEWEDVQTLHFEEAQVYYRFSVTLNSETATRLRLINNVDGSGKQVVRIVTYPTAPTDLAVPASPEVANVAAHSFTAKWTTVEGASGYRVVVFNNDGSRKTTQEVEGGNIIQYNFRNLDPETDYTFKVSAKGDGETTIDSKLSAAVEVKTSAEITDTYTRPVTSGNYGTICLPKAATDLSTAGAVFFKVAGKIMDGSALQEVVFDEVTALEKGVPYIFLAEADELNITLTGDAVAEPDNSSSNGLIGSFTVASVSNSVYLFILKDNKLYRAKDQAYYVGENRAYFDISQMDKFGGAAPAPGRRRISMSVEQEQNATGIENAAFINGVQKRIENGQLFIIRNGVKYNAAGQIVK